MSITLFVAAFLYANANFLNMSMVFISLILLRFNLNLATTNYHVDIIPPWGIITIYLEKLYVRISVSLFDIQF